MLTNLGIGTVIDIGANIGQYAGALREIGYKGEIISFEPLSDAYAELSKRAKADPKWRAFHCAIGAEDGEAAINVSGNSTSSSLLPMLDMHVRNEPRSRYVRTERIKVSTLVTALQELFPFDRRIYLKIDTQGYEQQVIQGAGPRLQQVEVLECELSFVPLYAGQCLFQDMLKLIGESGFSPVHFEPVFSDVKTGYCLQMNGLFVRGQ